MAIAGVSTPSIRLMKALGTLRTDCNPNWCHEGTTLFLRSDPRIFKVSGVGEGVELHNGMNLKLGDQPGILAMPSSPLPPSPLSHRVDDRF